MTMGIWLLAIGPLAGLGLVNAWPPPQSELAVGGSTGTVTAATAVSAGAAGPIVPSARVRELLVDLGLGAGGKAIRRSADGLFYLHGLVNGVSVRFLVDTGATSVVLTSADAARVGVLPAAAEFRYSASTAGGKTAMARVRLAQLAAGATERRDVEAVVAGNGLGVSLLGQSWLSGLNSLRISGDTMEFE